METSTLQAFLRVLYTVNNNPQYILAKSSSQIPVVRCKETTTQSATNEPSYARAPLKACLTVICDSSPELLQEPTRDFSLYVLDPLESQPMPAGLANPSQCANSPRGVAVALGLMSWALESTSVLATGTIIPNASPLALEVVFALRETKRVLKPILHPYPSFGSTSQPGPSQPPYLLHPLQAAQQTLTRSADFPELYIGPPRRAPGRPEGSISSKSKAKSQRSASFNSNGVDSQSESKGQAGKKPKQRPKPRSSRAPPAHSGPPLVCTPLTRNAVAGATSEATSLPAFPQQSHPPSQNLAQPQAHYALSTNNPLLGLLSALSGQVTVNPAPEQQVALLSAIQGLLATNPDLLQLATTSTGNPSVNEETAVKEDVTRSSNADDEGDDDDSDIVILNSSAVDTAAFRKSSAIQPSANQRPPTSFQGTHSSPFPASTPPSADNSTPGSSQTSTQASTPTLAPAGTPTSKLVAPRCIEGGSLTTLNTVDMPATPTPTRTRKRKLDEYTRSHSSLPLSPPSPSPSLSRVSSSGRVLVPKQRVHSSPTSRANLASSPPARLPSMLGAMRAVAASGSHSQAGSATTLISSSSKSREDTAPSNLIAPETSSLKRRRTVNLNEFMAEHEARKSTTKVRKPSSSGHKLNMDTSAKASQVIPLRSNDTESAPRQAQSSPPRPLFRSGPVASALPLPVSTFRTSFASANFLSMSSATFSSSGPSTSTTAPMKNPLKNFVMPAWARTSTAMLPRLSEEALARQRAEREAKKAQVASKRREAAKAKRRRLHGDRPSEESSDEEDEPVAMLTATSRTTPPSTSGVLSAPSSLPPPPTLPVFASDAMEPIPSSPPRSHRQLAAPAPPTTPPRKPIASGSGLHPSPSKSGPGSLFTPSSQDALSLFTPSTPSVTRSSTQAAFTPRSPTVLRRSGANLKSPRKSASGAPWTPRRHSGSHPTPRSLRAGKNPQVVTPGTVTRTPQTQTGMAPRPFLLPPPSPCAFRTPQVRKQVPSKVSTPHTKHEISPTQNVDDLREEDQLSRELEDALSGEDVSMTVGQCSPARPDQGTGDVGDTVPADDDYASSPLPPSSPLPISPFSSPAKLPDVDSELDPIPNILPDSDLLLPSVSDSDPAWFTDTDTNAWLTETDTWFTDTEGGPLTTDSDGAWLSDSDAAAGFGDVDMSRFLPPAPASSGTHWFSDETDGERLDEVVAFQRALAALVQESESGEKMGDGKTQAAMDPAFWEAVQLPAILGGEGAPVQGEDAAGGKQEDVQTLLDSLVGSTSG